MRKFLGGVLTVVAAIALTASFFSWAAHIRIVSPDYFAELLVEGFDQPGVKQDVADEFSEEILSDAGKRALLDAAVGAEDTETLVRDTMSLAVETPEFRSEYERAAVALADSAFGGSREVSFDGRPALQAVAPQADPRIAQALTILPADTFVGTADVDEEDLDDFGPIRSRLRTVAILGLVIGVTAVSGAVVLFRNASPFFAIGWITLPIGIFLFAVVRIVETAVLDDAADENALSLFVATDVLGRLRGITRLFLVLSAAIAIAHVVKMIAWRSRRNRPIGTANEGWNADPATDQYTQIIG